MRVIKQFGKYVQLREMVKKLKRFSLGRKEIVITFDDGYADNFHNAKLILEKHGIPATFFVVSDTVNNKEGFWWDKVGRLTVAAKMLPEVFEMTIAGTKYNWRVNLKEQPQPAQYEPDTYQNNAELSKIQLYYALWEILGRLSFKEREDTLRQIASWAGQSSIPHPDYLPMNSQELVSLASSPLFEIGAHTVSHQMLSRLPLEEQEEEITRGKHDLEDIINRSITSFSYPHGNYSSDTIRLVKQLKFENACTVIQKSIMRNTNPYLLPRFAVLNWDREDFARNLRKWLTQIT
jgi:peptidoglycan/xylan/chitin deacetylase (PgdA/CDA1 family)